MTLVDAIENPFADSPCREIPLSKPPLVRVIAQVRFPHIVAIDSRDFIASFQEGIRLTYPVLKSTKEQDILVEQGQLKLDGPTTVWRFSDRDDKWRVSLATNFVALDTTAYLSRADFLERLRTIIEVLDRDIQLSIIDRIGLRYIDRITGRPLQEIADLLRNEVLGIEKSTAAGHVQYSLCETGFSVPDAFVKARWGRIPPKASIDISAIDPINEASWILDFDMFSQQRLDFDIDEIMGSFRRYAEKIYKLFRWIVTEEFLRHYGGEM